MGCFLSFYCPENLSKNLTRTHGSFIPNFTPALSPERVWASTRGDLPAVALKSERHAPESIASPALLPVLLLMTALTQRHQVFLVQCDRWIVYIFRCDMYYVVHIDSRFDQMARKTDLTEPSMLSQHHLTAFPPCP